MIELKNIHKYYNPGSVNELCLFQNFSLEIPDGDFVAVVGSMEYMKCLTSLWKEM